MKRQRAAFALAGASVLALAMAPARAGEPAQAFLDGLRERGYYDTALDYLDSLAQNPAAPEAFKRTLLYEKGQTLVQGARLQRDPALRETQLDEGQKALEEFVKTQPGHLLVIAARSQLGSVLAERGRARIEKANKAAGAEKQNLLKGARGLYEQAGKAFAALVEELREKLKGYPAALDEKRDARRIEERDRYRQDFLQAQILVAFTREEMADTMETGSREWIAAITAAADGYKTVYETYRTRLAGLYARMHQGRCLQKLGKHKEASALFNDLLANPDTPDFRALKLKVMALAAESWLAQQLYVEVLNRAVPVVNSARPGEARNDELLALRLTIANACKAHAAQLRAKNPRDGQANTLLADGRRHVEFVTRIPSDYQDTARRMLPDFVAGDAAVAQRKEPRNFQEALAAARDAIDAMQAANLLVRTLPGQIAAAQVEARGELQKKLSEAQEQAAKSQADALHDCRLALQFADKQTELTDVNLVRYLLSYLLFNEGAFHDAVVLSEFLARRYPDSAGARPCAKIALAGYLKLYGEAAADDNELETQRIVSIADYIVQKWPDQPEAAEALNTLIPFMIRERKLDAAQEYLAKIPEDSPQRGSAELKMGQAMWATYLEGSRQLREWESGAAPLPDDVDLPARKQELEELKTRAKETLVKGVERMRKSDEVSQVVVTAVLSLAQIYVDTNEPGKAVALLEDSQIGPLTLVEADDPLAQREGIPEETYKTALRAYISSLAAPGGEAAAIIAKARGVMDSLKEHMSDRPDGQQKLVAIYVSLARDLQQQMEIADDQTKKSLGVGFESFLSQAAESATELDILNWIAETYRGMGESFGGDFRSLTPEGKGYFQKAVATYQKILDKGQADPQFLSPGMATQLQLQLAKSKKGMGDYIGAADALVSILKENQALLPVQIEAARLYQSWGGTGKGQERHYLSAMLGARPDAATGRNVLWGWGIIAKLTANNTEYRDQFHEARYNLALCRYHYALAQQDPAKKKEQMQMARRDIAFTAGLYPELGGEKWKPQYDNLLKAVQKALGEKPIGLEALKEPVAQK